MNTFRNQMLVLYAFLTVLSVFAVTNALALQQNPFVDYLGPLRWYGFGITIVVLLTIFGLIRRAKLAPRYVANIAWFALFFYFGVDLVHCAISLSAGFYPPGIFGAQTILITVLSLGSIKALRSPGFSTNYFSKPSVQQA
jgi:hypothetical protein